MAGIFFILGINCNLQCGLWSKDRNVSLERWKTEVEWEHDLYVEAQIWSDEPLRAFNAG